MSVKKRVQRLEQQRRTQWQAALAQLHQRADRLPEQQGREWVAAKARYMANLYGVPLARPSIWDCTVEERRAWFATMRATAQENPRGWEGTDEFLAWADSWLKEREQ